MNLSKKSNIKKYLCLLFFIGFSFNTYAQLNPMGSMYYFNPYLSNPAMAGLKDGVEVSGGYKAQWANIEGAPKMQALTGTFGNEDTNTGLGIMINNETSGVIRRSSFKGTFAYHLPLNDGSFVDFGLSAGVIDQGINFNKVVGNSNDATLNNFNLKKPYLDADFGVAFRGENFKVEAAMPNLKRLFKRSEDKTVMNMATYFAAASYKFNIEDFAFENIETKVSLRGIANYRNILDIGVSSSLLEEKLNVSVIYHSTNSLTFGLGTKFMDNFSVIGMYSTNTSAMNNISNGNFELGLKYSFDL